MNKVAREDKGSYILLLELPREQTITIGKLSHINFFEGYYAYVGSALNGLNSRINRHLRRDKKIHWHIDYLLQKAYISSIIIYLTNDRIECKIAQALNQNLNYIPGFGSSDCHCRSHLFFNPSEMESNIIEITESQGMMPKLIQVKAELTK
ncbi:DUF123 domain-containing protein [Chloroflexota bacterium]